MIKEIHLSTAEQTAFLDITADIEKVVESASVKTGTCIVFVPHTTAAVTINENADPSVRKDIITLLDRVVPENASYEHAEGNSPAHAKASIIGNSLSVPVKGGALLLGTWQGIYFCEFDGPRTRRVIIKVTKD